MENNMNPEIYENCGDVNISDEVISVIASLAASDVKGVAGMVTGVAGGFAELLGKKNLSKGVKIIRVEDSIGLELSVVIEYGEKIPDVAWQIQDKVKSEVESMTGMEISFVNVSVDSVNVAAPEKVKEEKPTEDISNAEDVAEEAE